MYPLFRATISCFFWILFSRFKFTSRTFYACLCAKNRKARYIFIHYIAFSSGILGLGTQRLFYGSYDGHLTSGGCHLFLWLLSFCFVPIMYFLTQLIMAHYCNQLHNDHYIHYKWVIQNLLNYKYSNLF